MTAAMTRYSLAEVRAELDRYIAAKAAGDGTFTALAAVMHVNQALNGGIYDAYDHATEGQARRDLDLRAKRGDLIRTGVREAGPGGEVNRTRQPVFRTPQAYELAAAAAEARYRSNAAVVAGWARIHDALAAMDIEPLSRRGEQPRISTANWDKVLGLPPGRE